MFDKADNVRQLVRDIPDFPKPGIVFRDITPLLANPEVFEEAIDLLEIPFSNKVITKVAGIDSRGFLFGMPVAQRLGVGFIPVRKAGKLPHKTVSESFDLEYGTDSLEIHEDSVTSDDNILIIDDLLATGGTAAAAAKLFEKCGATVSAIAFLIELEYLNGYKKLSAYQTYSVLHYFY